MHPLLRKRRIRRFVEPPYLFFIQFHYIAFPAAADMVTMCSVPTFFLVSAVQDASQNFILHNRSKPGQSLSCPGDIARNAHPWGVRVFFKGSIQSKGGEETGR